jgi:sulfur carrier protein ThiS
MTQSPAMIEVEIVPFGKKEYFNKSIQIKFLLKNLGILQNEALVTRNGKILTRDLFAKKGDRIEIRLVTSRG